MLIAAGALEPKALNRDRQPRSSAPSLASNDVSSAKVMGCGRPCTADSRQQARLARFPSTSTLLVALLIRTSPTPPHRFFLSFIHHQHNSLHPTRFINQTHLTLYPSNSPNFSRTNQSKWHQRQQPRLPQPPERHQLVARLPLRRRRLARRPPHRPATRRSAPRPERRPTPRTSTRVSRINAIA